MDGSWVTTNSIYQQSSVTLHDFSPRYGWQSEQSNCNLNGNEKELYEGSLWGFVWKYSCRKVTNKQWTSRILQVRKYTVVYPLLRWTVWVLQKYKIILPQIILLNGPSLLAPCYKTTNYTRGNKWTYPTDVKISTASTMDIKPCWKNGRYNSSINPGNLLM
jgi:hypothetical protein